MRRKLLLATNNQGKVCEYKSLLNDIPFELVTLAEEGITTLVDEVGESLEENAKLKATVLAAESQLLALADDSGLEVDILGGEPGPLSARYAGEGTSDREKVNYLLSRLKDIPWPKRSARSITTNKALGTSTPTSITVVATSTCINPSRKSFITADFSEVVSLP